MLPLTLPAGGNYGPGPFVPGAGMLSALSTAARRLPRSTWLLIAAAAAVVAVEGVYAVFKRTNDYNVHLWYGNWFLEGRPYSAPGAGFYPLGRVWFDAGFASVEYYTGRAFCYVAALAGLGLSLVMWRRLSGAAAPLPEGKAAAAAWWTVLVLAAFLVRDLDECGLHLLLLFFLSAAGYARMHGRSAATGFWLAVAVVYKATPLLFLPLLVWKREWRTAGWTVAFTAALSLLPATYLGWNETLSAHRAWFVRTADILGKQEAYPSSPGFEPPKQQNVSLRAAFARFVESHPPGHPLRLDHPLFVQPGNLPPRQAKAAVMGLTLLLGAAIAWRMRRQWSAGPVRPGGAVSADFAPEWAVACLFTSLMSPVCWRQHLVLALPCVYLVARERLRPGAVGGWRKWFPAVAGAVFLLAHRTVIGTDLAHVAVSYKLDTFGLLGFTLLALTLPRPDAAETASAAPPAPALAA